MSPVIIYTKPFCPYCARALQVLQKKGATITEIEAGMNPQKKQEMMQKAAGRSTFPQIFIGERHVGGCDDLIALDRQGELDKLLAA